MTGCPAWPRTREALLLLAQADAAPHLVQLDLAAIEALPKGTIVSDHHLGPLPVPASVHTLDSVLPYVVALSSINHRFWTLDGHGSFVRYGVAGQVGANAMFQAFQRHWSNSYSALSRARWENRPIQAMDVVDQFGALPGTAERAAILNEVLLGSTLDQWTKKLLQRLQAGTTLTVDDAAELADAFPLAFGDPYLKKAQFALSHIARHATARGHAVGCGLTAFADYQIPSVLRAMGLLGYAPDLERRVDQGMVLDRDSAEERAIRGASILLVEHLARHQEVQVIDVDQWLWQRRHQATAPFHRTFTSAY